MNRFSHFAALALLIAACADPGALPSDELETNAAGLTDTITPNFDLTSSFRYFEAQVTVPDSVDAGVEFAVTMRVRDTGAGSGTAVHDLRVAEGDFEIESLTVRLGTDPYPGAPMAEVALLDATDLPISVATDGAWSPEVAQRMRCRTAGKIDLHVSAVVRYTEAYTEEQWADDSLDGLPFNPLRDIFASETTTLTERTATFSTRMVIDCVGEWEATPQVTPPPPKYSPAPWKEAI